MANELIISGETLVHLVARTPQEMASAQSDLKLWLQGKIRACKAEVTDLSQASTIAVERKWESSTLKRHTDLARKRLEFYTKVLGAVDAGFTIVPNFPIDLFAMRVNRKNPAHHTVNSSYSTPNIRIPEPMSLPSGEGRYVSADTARRTTDKFVEGEGDKKKTTYMSTTVGYSDVEFPVMAARPEVMSATADALALKLFDAVGICPQQRKGDPLIIGQVRMPKVGWSDPKIVSFLIAWHLDMRTL